MPIIPLIKPSPGVPLPRRLLELLLPALGEGRSLATVLRSQGHEVTVVDDCDAALDILAQAAFDVLLVHLARAEPAIFSAIKLYRFMALGLPQAAIVGVADPADGVEVSAEAGVVDTWLAWPVNEERLRATLAGIMNPAGAPRTGTVVEIASHPAFRQHGRADTLSPAQPSQAPILE